MKIHKYKVPKDFVFKTCFDNKYKKYIEKIVGLFYICKTHGLRIGFFNTCKI